MKQLIILGLIGLSIDIFGQYDVTSKELEIRLCLDQRVSGEQWTYLTEYFESYLVKGGFGESREIEKAYLEFIDYRTGFPPRKMPYLEERNNLKENLISWKIIDGQNTYSSIFIDCFYSPNTDFESYPESTIKDVVSIAEALSKFDVSSNLIMEALKESLTEVDFRKDVYKRTVILLGLIEVMYIEELVLREAKDDNPIFRVLQERMKDKNLKTESGETSVSDPRLDVKPGPIGGLDQYHKWIYDNNRKLGKPDELGGDYKVIVQAEVDEQGNVGKIGVWRGIGRGYDEEAYRLIKSHPVQKWTVGKLNGDPVKVKVEIEIDFRVK